MALLKRIIWYLFGVGLGLVLVIFILKQKNGGKGVEYCYLPNCRVLKELRSKPLELSVSLQNKDTSGIAQALLKGDVQFRRSDVHKEPCGEYWILWNQKELQLANCSTAVRVLHWDDLP